MKIKHVNDLKLRRELAVSEGKNAELENKLNKLIEHQGINVTQLEDGVYEVSKDIIQPEGDYTNPIPIPPDGITTSIGKWYYVDDKDLPHEAIRDAFVIPEDFNDRTWFDCV